ncbi:uncharacterized protein HMPREF1541_06082 [Cyphellophora europaea CBS 101466]|uniref:CsbD-like domain-containing protein n=1 Tax=Cyphellophora europaea (strain CBS 101466) TaxID=1220924 RepID=W2RTM8_CYPE1|nr:uncharacterized protein HMPREF1541_06082 [Cyphellophora europaea CBS 101466]ETN39856.1 hypothetical protein HMPREF1541_06082 [Cyphellophora europaea CBS 101466]
MGSGRTRAQAQGGIGGEVDDPDNSYGTGSRRGDDFGGSTRRGDDFGGSTRRDDDFGGNTRRDDGGEGKKDSTVGKLMEKAGGMLKNENLQQKGAEKRGSAGNDY